MNIYNYINYQKTSLVNAIVFTCEANDINDADALATKAGFVPVKLTCSIGVKLVFHFDTKAMKLVSESVTHTLNEDGSTKKIYRNMSEWFYNSNEHVTRTYSSKLEAVKDNESLIKKYLYNSSVGIFWDTPPGPMACRTWLKRDEIHSLLTLANEGKKEKKNK